MFPLKVVVTGLTVDEARVVEQALISAYGKENLENRIWKTDIGALRLQKLQK